MQEQEQHILLCLLLDFLKRLEEKKLYCWKKMKTIICSLLFLAKEKIIANKTVFAEFQLLEMKELQSLHITGKLDISAALLTMVPVGGRNDIIFFTVT